MERDQAAKLMQTILRKLADAKGSDLFITAGFPPAMKVNGEVRKASDQVLTADEWQVLSAWATGTLATTPPTAQQVAHSTAVLSHGDTKHLMLIPASAEECYEFTMKAFDLAVRFQTPVFVMTDLDLGMNTWMADSFRYPDRPFDRGKRLDAATLKTLGDWGRYMDVDGDGIPWRTVPGDGLPAYFNRGSGHNAKGQYSERADDYTANVDRLAKKFETARSGCRRRWPMNSPAPTWRSSPTGRARVSAGIRLARERSRARLRHRSCGHSR